MERLCQLPFESAYVFNVNYKIRTVYRCGFCRIKSVPTWAILRRDDHKVGHFKMLDMVCRHKFPLFGKSNDNI